MVQITYKENGKMNYPIKITEVPHRGKRREWTLYDEKHLNECVQQAYRTSYDGDGSLDSYLEWVRHDLSEFYTEAA